MLHDLKEATDDQDGCPFTGNVAFENCRICPSME
jgi:hypothetical protein